ncbi:ATP-binding cassette sub-family A member like [Actinidia chinensis var. chinensis]|uniref:ATP-binding cassette sub-family A member like n=1 Tax=Actinidia chinensis var. chinensis TaxID=1590841 RepID=A0A2R6QYP0_ACTCC|nr:ATP-binding cassette sub-family A member like [Actinidia chinensis var. chinensis]
MDREQEEMQFLGLFGIYIESYKIIFSWRKIFSKITLALILPLSFIFLAHIEISELLFWKILHTERQLDRTPVGTRRYEKLSDVVSSEWINFWLFKIAYFTFLLIFSLLSTSAVVYTIASIYTAREVTFRKVMSVVPKVWKRLMVTFLCAFSTFFLYNIIAMLTLFMWVITIANVSVAGLVAFVIILILYAIGFVYLSIVWQLASVVTVLEESYGFRAMIKSKNLIKGKMWIAIIIFFKLNLSLLAIQILFESLVVRGWSISVLGRVGFGILCLLLLFKLFLFGLVIQTVIYFVCKSYHHENIDKSILSDHLEVYLGEYEPLKAKDVQLEQLHV